MEVIIPISPKLKLNIIFSFNKSIWEEDPLKLHSSKTTGFIQTLVGEFSENNIPNKGLEQLIRVKKELFNYLSQHLHDSIKGNFYIIEICIIFS